MRPSFLAGTLGLLACLLVGTAAGAEPARIGVLLADPGGIYLRWSEAEGARVGARVALVDPNGVTIDTVDVRWTRDAITALNRGSGRAGTADINSMWWAVALEGAAPATVPSGTLTVPLLADPATLDPALVTSLAEKQVATQIFEGLVRFDPHFEPVAAAADSFVQRGRVWRFHLRPDGRFHDGRPVRAQDVVATLMRSLAPDTHAPRVEGLVDAIVGASAFHAGRAAAISGIIVRDSLTLTITVTRERAPLLAELSGPAAFLVPLDLAAAKDFAQAPVGSGPFRFVRMGPDGVVLRAAPGRTGGVDSLVFRRVDGPDDAALQFELGRLDIVSARESDERRLTAAESDPPTTIAQDEAATYYVGLNTRLPWLARVATRRSLAASIDRALAVKVLVPRRGRLARGLLPPAFGLPELPDSAWRPAPEEARAWPALPPVNGLSFWVPQGSATGERMAEFVQAALARRGLKVRIVVRPWAEFERALLEGQADLFYLSWFADGPDPAAFVASMVEGKRLGVGGNRTFYRNVKVDALLAAARNAPTKERAQASLLDAEAVALSDAPLVPLFHSVNVVLKKPWVTGFVPDPLGAPRYDQVEVRRGH